VGHSNHSWERFADLTSNAAIETIVDVRSIPFSRFNRQFNRQNLEASLKTIGVNYIFLGAELGARSDDEACYENGRVRYDRLSKTDRFKSGMLKVRDEARLNKLALMCAEKDPLQCHRFLLISVPLAREGYKLCHLLADGSLEPHENTLNRLLEAEGLKSSDLFRSQEELIEEACLRLEDRIAYRRKSK